MSAHSVQREDGCTAWYSQNFCVRGQRRACHSLLAETAKADLPYTAQALMATA